MTATQEMSMETELLKEVESYLPAMRGFLRVLAVEGSSQNDETIKELHRMTHSIRGAAAMVLLDDLSKTAGLMEDVLDTLLEKKRDWNEQLIDIMNQTIDSIASYCTAMYVGTADGAALYRNASQTFEPVKTLPSVSSAAGDDESFEDDALLALLGDDGEEDSTDDLFQALFDEKEGEGAGDGLVIPPAAIETSSKDITLDAFLSTEEKPDSEEESLESFLGVPESDSFDLPQDAPSEAAPLIQASGIDPDLQESFNEEAEEHLENIGRQLNELSSSVSSQVTISAEYREKLHSIRRSVHTLKGAAAVIGIEPVASWGHLFEDFLDSVHDESDTLSPESIAAMLDGADILEKIAADPAVDVSAEIILLQAVFPGVMADSSSADEAPREERLVQAVDIEAEPETSPDSIDTIPEDEDLDIFQGIEMDDFGDDKPEMLPAMATEEDASQVITATDVGDIDELLQAIAKETASEQVSCEKSGEKSSAEQKVPLRVTGSKSKQKQVRKSTLRVGSEKIAELMGLGGDMAITLSSFEDSAFSMQSSLDEFEITLKRLTGIASSLEAGYELASIPHLGSTGDGGQDKLGVQDEFDPLEMDRYSELHILIRSLNEAIVDLGSIKEQAFDVQSSWRQAVDRQRMVVSEVQGSVNAIQMTPFSTIANRLYKTVRESARVTGKKVRLLIEGGSMEMDTYVWDVLVDALMHMLRNCVDHGIESADIREQLDKPDQATIRIDCSRQGSRFVLKLSDDGNGFDYDAIRSRGIELYPESGVEQMDNNGLAELVFQQGFSVRKNVTTMSGRGVGMDVVRDSMEQLNGLIEVQSTPGLGTDFVLSMPIVVAQLPALMVLFGEQQFAVPMRDVSTVLRLSAEEMLADSYEFENEQLPLLWPVDLLGLKNSAGSTDDRSSLENNPLAFVVDTGGRRGVLMADTVLGQRDIVFKSLGNHLQNIPCVAGATILGDGSLVPILQTEDMFRRSEMLVRTGETTRRAAKDEEKTLEILIADDSISVRKVLSNFVTAHDWRATVASDGVDAMEKIRERTPDLMLLDIEMPRMNGFEVLQAMQSQSAYRDVPVLMLTSRSAAKYRKKAAELGASGFVTKPFKDDELLSLIKGLTTHKMTEGDLQ